jgi:preprotein translocase subunit SecD
MAMNPMIKKLFFNWRMIILGLFLIFALVAIHPNPWADGATIRSVAKNSSAAIAGIESPTPTSTPMSRERILWMNNQRIYTVDDYSSFVSKLELNQTLTIKTTKASYKLVTKEIFAGNESTGTIEDIGLKVYPAPTTNIRKGLDLQGGTRVILLPDVELAQDEFDTLLENMKQRLNVYGLTDIAVKGASDLPKALGGSGKQFIIVEIAGTTEEEVKELLAKQGKFEAKVGNETVFRGGQDIKYVCRTADCSGIDPNQGCGKIETGWACSFRFSIALSPEAAQRQADATQKLGFETKNGEKYLDKPLDLFLDDNLVDSLNIASDLKGRAVTDIAISGSGTGVTQQEAMNNALANMKKLQTILITGSLPVKLNIEKMDTLSASLGEQFIKNSFFVGGLAVLAVALVIFIRYRKLSVSIPVIGGMISEVVLIVGFAALVGWNIDLASIAGIIISIGTGVNHLIIIADESLKKESAAESYLRMKEKIKRAFFIIFASYSAVLVAMIPLLFAGAGLLKGFAITTIAGISFGVFIARPAFAEIIQIVLKE